MVMPLVFIFLPFLSPQWLPCAVAWVSPPRSLARDSGRVDFRLSDASSSVDDLVQSSVDALTNSPFLTNNKIIGDAITKLTPLGDVMDVVDTANEAADALSAQGVSDEIIVVLFGVAAVVAGLGYYYLQSQKDDDEDTNSSLEEVESSESMTTAMLQESLRVEQTCRKELQAQVDALVADNRNMCERHQLLQAKEENLSQRVTELSKDVQRLEDKYEGQSMRRLAKEMWQLGKDRVWRRFQRLKERLPGGK